MDGGDVNTSVVPAGMVLLQAQGSVADAWTRLEAAIAGRGLTVFARIDLAAGAAARRGGPYKLEARSIQALGHVVPVDDAE